MSAKWAVISPVVSPFAYNDRTISSTPVSRRCRNFADLRLEAAVPVPRHLDLHLPGGFGQHRLRPGPVADVGGLPVLRSSVLLMLQVLAHLLVQRRLQHRLGELLEQ